MAAVVLRGNCPAREVLDEVIEIKEMTKNVLSLPQNMACGLGITPLPSETRAHVAEMAAHKQEATSQIRETTAHRHRKTPARLRAINP